MPITPFNAVKNLRKDLDKGKNKTICLPDVKGRNENLSCVRNFLEGEYINLPKSPCFGLGSLTTQENLKGEKPESQDCLASSNPVFVL